MTVSRHLGYLRKRGLVVGRKDGLWVHYRLAKPSESTASEADRLHRGSAAAKLLDLKQDLQRLAHSYLLRRMSNHAVFFA